MSAGDRERGLYPKYRVERIEDPDGKHVHCGYFVLDPQHDPIALAALKFYARRSLRAGYAALYRDLWRWVRGIEQGGAGS